MDEGPTIRCLCEDVFSRPEGADRGFDWRHVYDFFGNTIDKREATPLVCRERLCGTEPQMLTCFWLFALQRKGKAT